MFGGTMHKSVASTELNRDAQPEPLRTSTKVVWKRKCGKTPCNWIS